MVIIRGKDETTVEVANSGGIHQHAFAAPRSGGGIGGPQYHAIAINVEGDEFSEVGVPRNRKFGNTAVNHGRGSCWCGRPACTVEKLESVFLGELCFRGAGHNCAAITPRWGAETVDVSIVFHKC